MQVLVVLVLVLMLVMLGVMLVVLLVMLVLVVVLVVMVVLLALLLQEYHGISADAIHTSDMNPDHIKVSLKLDNSHIIGDDNS